METNDDAGGWEIVGVSLLFTARLEKMLNMWEIINIGLGTKMMTKYVYDCSPRTAEHEED